MMTTFSSRSAVFEAHIHRKKYGDYALYSREAGLADISEKDCKTGEMLTRYRLARYSGIDEIRNVAAGREMWRSTVIP